VPEEIVEITVRPDGKVEMRVTGIAGMDCLAETEDLARLLGGDIEAQELTAEAYQDTGEYEQDRLRH
jgi:hypothetical protein